MTLLVRGGPDLDSAFGHCAHGFNYGGRVFELRTVHYHSDTPDVSTAEAIDIEYARRHSEIDQRRKVRRPAGHSARACQQAAA